MRCHDLDHVHILLLGILFVAKEIHLAPSTRRDSFSASRTPPVYNVCPTGFNMVNKSLALAHLKTFLFGPINNCLETFLRSRKDCHTHSSRNMTMTVIYSNLKNTATLHCFIN
jgi:hypothetical protein